MWSTRARVSSGRAASRALSAVPINPFGAAGTVKPLSGDDTSITSLAFTPGGTVYYTASGSGGFGNVGTINLTTGVTTRLLSSVPAAHGMQYDPFSNTLVLGGDSHISQMSLATNTIVGDLTVAGDNFDQGAVDGLGHIFWADNGGRMFFLDYSTTMDVGSRTLLQVSVEQAATADAAISTLMGDDVEARKQFIQKNAKDVRFIDI